MTPPTTPRKRAATKRSPGKTSTRRPAAPAEPTEPEKTPQEDNPAWGSNRKAAEATIVALREDGHLENVDSARIATLQALADAVDADPANASLWREYRATEASLREGNDITPPGVADLVAALSAEVGDKKNADQADARRPSRRRG